MNRGGGFRIHLSNTYSGTFPTRQFQINSHLETCDQNSVHVGIAGDFSASLVLLTENLIEVRNRKSYDLDYLIGDNYFVSDLYFPILMTGEFLSYCHT